MFKKSIILIIAIAFFSSSLTAKEYYELNGKRTTTQKVDEFGKMTETSICKALEHFENKKKEGRKTYDELAIVYSEIFEGQLNAEGLSDLHGVDEYSNTRIVATIRAAIPYLQNVGDLPSSIDVTIDNLQTKDSLIKVSRDIYSLTATLNQYLSSTIRETTLERAKVLYSYFLANKAIYHFPTNNKCELMLDNLIYMPTVYFSRALNSSESKIGAIKLLSVLEKNNSKDVTKYLLSFEEVKYYYDILNKSEK